MKEYSDRKKLTSSYNDLKERGKSYRPKVKEQKKIFHPNDNQKREDWQTQTKYFKNDMVISINKALTKFDIYYDKTQQSEHRGNILEPNRTHI